ncbi:MAG TPA: tail fiber domain-containing protein, partial [Flavisolibacter sp.]|nr:tail fiber domain-containing protein [Flavisolibacter sp.]
FQGSDKKLKEDVTEIADAMAIIGRLQPKYFKYRSDGDYKLMNLPSGRHYGLVAQDLEQVLPSLVKQTDFNTGKIRRFLSPVTQVKVRTKGNKFIEVPRHIPAKEEKGEDISFKAINYTELIPILIKGMQEQQKQIEELKEMVRSLQGNSGQPSTLSGSKLDQNFPNPFHASSVIRYYVPVTAHQAQLIVKDAKDALVKVVSLNGKGSGQVTIDAGALAEGAYTYSLWVDDQQIATKKMVIVK